MAFASKWIRDPQDVYNVDIPDRLQSVPIEWAEEWKTVPLLRRDSTGKVYTSPKLASQFNQMSAWNRRLGRSFGMKEIFEQKSQKGYQQSRHLACVTVCVYYVQRLNWRACSFIGGFITGYGRVKKDIEESKKA